MISPDNSTLFTTSGMQHFKSLYVQENYINTFTNVQKCLRLNDLQEVGDGTHYLTFDMMGLFSFRQWTVPQSIDFFMEFLQRLNLKPDFVTIHPDKYQEWKSYYQNYSVEIRLDESCIWSDGNIGGYCTEFYKDNIEIGNIVNPLGTCIDVGFGLERLLQVCNSLPYKSKLEILEETCLVLINSGIEVGHNGPNYILKKLIIDCVLEGSRIDLESFNKIRQQQILNFKNYLKNVKHKKYKDKNDEFWLQSFGIDIRKLKKYEDLIKNIPCS